MPIRRSDESCPECGSGLQVIYATELEQVVSGWACPACGFVASKKEGFQETVSVSKREEYVLRIERPLTSDDVEGARSSVVAEFRARAREQATGREVWSLVDPEDGSIVDLYAPEGDDDAESDAGSDE